MADITTTVVDSYPVPESPLEADLSRILSVQGVRASTILALVLPILVLYPYLQRYFVTGIRIGPVKG